MTASSHNIVGRSAEVIVTDPWDFMTQLGTKPLPGRVESCEERSGLVTRIVVELLTPINYRGTSIGRIDATPRHRDSPTVEAILRGAGMPANMEGVPADAAVHDPIPLLGEIRVR